MKTYRGTSLDNPGQHRGFRLGRPGGLSRDGLLSRRGLLHRSVLAGRHALYTSYFVETTPCRARANRLLSPSQYRSLPTRLARSPGAQSEALRNTSGVLRTYRMAVAGTGEYTAFHGGTAGVGTGGRRDYGQPHQHGVMSATSRCG